MLLVSISVKGMYEQWKSDPVAQTHASSDIWDTLGLLTWHLYANPEIFAFLGYHIWQDYANSPVSKMTWESFVQAVEQDLNVCVFHHFLSPRKKNQLYTLLIRDTPFKCQPFVFKFKHNLENLLYMNFTYSAKHEHENSEVPSPLCRILCSLGCQIIAHSPGDKYNRAVEPQRTR